MKWGFLGYGRIARKFEESLRFGNEEIHAIASRSQYDRIPKEYVKYKDYSSLLNDHEIDIVYVSTTHNTHAKHAIDALNSGKHVLCEKPLAISPDEVEEMFEASEKNDRFLMEAIWSRYLPGYQKAISMIKEGAIGDVQFISAHFGFRMNPDQPKERLIDPDLAAGAIWDVGIYPISLVQDIFEDDPQDIQVHAKLSSRGVEDRCSVMMSYDNSRFAQFSCGIDLGTINKALITGTAGTVEMDDFWKCEKFTITNDGGTRSYSVPMSSTGLIHEAVACRKMIEQGMTSSPLITRHHSLQLSKIMEEVIYLARKS